MRKFRSKFAVILLLIISITFICSTNVFAEDSWDFAERGYNELSGYSAQDFYDTSIGESDSGHRQKHAQTLCAHRGANAKHGNYTKIRAVVKQRKKVSLY